MSNSILAIDLLISLLNATIRIQSVLSAAQAEGRDVTKDELTLLKVETNELRDKWFGK